MIPLEFMRGERLWLLLLVPVIAVVYYLLATRRSQSRGKRAPSRLDLVVPKDQAWKRHGAVALALLSLAALVVAFAMPKAHKDVPRDRATIVVTMDVSLSMAAEDVEPNRLVAAQNAAISFVQSLPPRFNVALVTFAGTTNIAVPPTTDRNTIVRAIQSIELEPSTAIGDGVYASLDALKLLPDDPAHPGETAPAAVVLLSDGGTNIGRPSAGAAQEAAKQEVPVYTIAYGTADGYVMDRGRRQRVPVNHRELLDVARLSGGKKFSAASAGELTEVYRAISQSVGYEKVYVEVTDTWAGVSLVFAILASLGVISLGARWP